MFTPGYKMLLVEQPLLGPDKDADPAPPPPDPYPDAAAAADAAPPDPDGWMPMSEQQLWAEAAPDGLKSVSVKYYASNRRQSGQVRERERLGVGTGQMRDENV